MNDRPINDLLEALEILDQRFQESPRYLYFGTHRADPAKAELWLDWYRDGDSGGDRSGTHYLEIDHTIAKQLVDERYVEPMKEVGWGRTDYSLEKRVLAEQGKKKIRELYEEKKLLAHSLIVPSEHSKFCTVFTFDDSDFEHRRFGGEIYFDFKTIMGDRVRVYPDSKRVEKLKDKHT